MLALAALTIPSFVFAASEPMPTQSKPPGGYISSANVRKFEQLDGFAYNGSTYIACQLYNSNVNDVGHGTGECAAYSYNQYVRGRVYNQSSGITTNLGGNLFW